MNRGFVTVLLAGAVAGCQSTAPPEESAAQDEPPSIAVTEWSERTELFMEYPPLVAEEEARFAIHLTDLATFAPLREGRVVVRFEGDTIERFETDGPATPGIFGVTVTVPAARRYQLAVEVHTSAFQDEHHLGAVTVYPDADTASAALGFFDNGEGATTFLKEQQWTLDFATMRVESGARRAIVNVPGTVEPRVGGSVEVRAPAAGRIAAGGGRAAGVRVAAGDLLVELIVRNERIGEAPVLTLELAEAEAQLRLAREDLARVERLAEAGAVPRRRVAEAQAAVETAGARAEIAREQLRHLQLSRTGEGSGDPGERVVARAPIAGVVAESHATPGATVAEGQLLFRIVAVDRVHVVGAVPEQHLARVGGVEAAEVRVPGLQEPLTTTRLIALGRVVDPASRSVPITFELADPPPAVAVGQAVTLGLITEAPAGEISVPADAVVDDGGQSIVFVQVGGESFERRPVRVGGAREGGFVQIVSGLNGGERVVVRGGHLVRLAALSPQTPGHGHVH